MKNVLYILIIASVWSCSTTLTDIDLTVRKDKIVFHDWYPKELNSTVATIYIWNKKENKISDVPVAGEYKYDNGNKLVFIPNFPLLENTEYVFVRNVEGKKRTQRFTLPKKKRNPLTVSAVYPSNNELPENLLRMYINFSQPMKTTGNLEQIKLVNEQGKEIEGAIFNNVYELWDTSQKQLTIIFDPARVKTDLVVNKELGRALTPNKTFKVIVGNVEDIYGQKLAKPFAKTFKVTKADYIAPNIDYWKVITPKSNTKKSLMIHFVAPLDRMSLYNRIRVVGDNNEIIQGKIDVVHNERTWIFTPISNWKKGNYKLQVNARLEDPSGNNLNGLFDHKAGSLKNDKEGEIITIPLKIKEQ